VGPDKGATRFSGWFSSSADGADSEIHARLRPSLRAGSVAIEEHDHAGVLTGRERELLSVDTWSISGIVLWELSKLVQLGRLEMDLDDSDVVRALSKIYT